MVNRTVPAAALPVRAGVPGDRVGGWGTLERLRGWRVLDLHGTDERIGERYGELLREELRSAWAPLNDRLYRRLPAAFRAWFLHTQRRFRGFLDPPAEARLRGLARAIGLRPARLRRYAWLADLGSIGPALQLALGGTVQLDATTGALSDRCTTAIGRDGDATVHARNLDYWGMGFWQPHATLLFVEPLDARGQPDGLRYAHLGTVGELLAGTTGVNEAGVAISTHLHVTRDVALVGGRLRSGPARLAWEGLAGDARGESVYALVERVLRWARTVAEAVALLEAAEPVGAWSFALSDPSGARAVVDVDRARRRTTWGVSVHTNFYRDPAMRAREAHPTRGPLEGARLRHARAEALLGPGPLPVARAIAILRDGFDLAVGRARPVSANSPLSPDTAQSAVIVTRPGRPPEIWTAEPAADGFAPAPLGAFFALSFDDGFAGPGARRIRGALPADDADREVLGRYVQAMHLALDARDPRAAAAALRAIPTDDPGVRLMAAWASAATGDLDLAAAELARFEPARASHHHRRLAALLEGELHWRAGRRDDARRAFSAGLALRDDGPDAPLDGPLGRVLEDHLARLGRRPRRKLPFPDLKFQDVLELRVE